LSEYFTRTAFAAAVVAASVFIHLGLLGMIVMAERRSLAKPQIETIEVELLKPELAEPPKEEEPPPRENSAPQEKQQKPQPKSSQKSAKVSLPEPQTAEPPPLPENEEKPDIPSGGPPSETKAKLTAEEIAAFRAEIQKCWELMVGVPDAMKLEVVLRVGLTRKGALAGSPDLLKAPASVHGPRLVGIAMKAMQQCGPYKSLPAAKYNEWKVLDLRFLATGMAGLDTTKIDVSKLPRG
jgi:hypothetical protein